MRNLRKVNIDHLHVGWYQSTYFGGFINKALLESQFNYQHSIEESIVLIYGKLINLRKPIEMNFIWLPNQIKEHHDFRFKSLYFIKMIRNKKAKITNKYKQY